jgi:RES domain-containing protein
MSYDRRILDCLERAPKGAWRGQGWRYTPKGIPPDRENTRGARWNRPTESAIYTALAPETAIAELRHALSVQSPPPTRGEFVLHRVAIELDAVVDLRTWDLLAGTGLTVDDVRNDDHTACRTVGSAARWLSIGALLVPSARRANSANLVIYPDRQLRPMTFEVEDREILIVGQPPLDL